MNIKLGEGILVMVPPSESLATITVKIRAIFAKVKNLNSFRCNKHHASNFFGAIFGGD